MKKMLFCLLAVAGLTMFCSFKQASVPSVNVNTSDEEVVFASATRTVTCIKFNGNITIKTQGHYDPDNDTITIAGNTYRVRVNPNRGDGTKRGDYYYMAGDYYFNL